MAWTFGNPTVVEFGLGVADRLAERIAGRPWALVTYGLDLFRERAARLARDAGDPVAVIDNIVANPDFKDLAQSCAAYAAAPRAPEVIVALGGGSIIDGAKVLAASGGRFETVRRHLLDKAPLEGPFPAIVAVPTTAGTGSEVTSWATVWDAANGRKYSLADRRLYPAQALVDPGLTTSAPRDLTLATGLDALSHALESVWNVSANPVSSTFAVTAAREIMEVLPRLLRELDSPSLRERQARAALFAGLAFSNTKTALAHNISYDVTLRRGVPHGIACSFPLPMVMRWAIGQDRDCDATLRLIFGDDLAAGAERLRAFLEGLGVATEPASYGFDGAAWGQLVERALDGERGRNFIGRLDRAA